jgi:uncharacterized DUF497 family protein
VGLTFEWDRRKAAANLAKHGVSFLEASTAFGDPSSLTIADEEHSDADEKRWVLLGRSFSGRIVVVVHVERHDNLRIISARRATRAERATYEQG